MSGNEMDNAAQSLPVTLDVSREAAIAAGAKLNAFISAAIQKGTERTDPSGPFDPDAHVLVQAAQLAVEAIERFPNWLNHEPLVTARAHAWVLVHDLPEALAPPASDWVGIGSAPRDGTRVLLWAPHWNAPQTGWTFGTDAWQDARKDTHVTPPTHWMPLPTPPGEDGREGGSGSSCTNSGGTDSPKSDSAEGH